MTKILEKINQESINKFYNGYVYPIIISGLVLVGSLFGIEMFTLAIHTILIFGACLYSDSVKPFMISLCTFAYQVSRKNAPQRPYFSDFYTNKYVIAFIAAFAVLIIAGIVVFCVRRKIFAKISFKSTPLLLPVSIFSLSLLINGIFSGEWVFDNLVFGVINVIVYFFFYVFFLHGFGENETSSELASYFSYIAMLAGAILSLQMIDLYLTSDTVISGGTIVKDQIVLGWGSWTVVALCFAVVIPLMFYGVLNNRYPWLYFGVATVTYVMTILTMSRNALIFATLGYVCCVILCCFVGKHKKAFRIITVTGIVAIAVLAFLLRDNIYTFFKDHFDRGLLNDNGRYPLWRAAFESFLESPIFGSGFYGINFDTYDQFGFVPKMAHQTILQILGSMGIFGILAYGYYRVNTAIMIFKKPSVMKSIFAISILVLLLESMLDNFVFSVYPVMYYVISLAIIGKSAREEKFIA